MTEEGKFQKKFTKWLDTFSNVWWVKFHASGMTRVGVPDILACIDGSFVAFELKTDDGEVSAIQGYTLDRIQQTGGYGFVVMPSTFEHIKEIVGKNLRLIKKGEKE